MEEHKNQEEPDQNATLSAPSESKEATPTSTFIQKCRSIFCQRRLFIAVGLGQILSVLICGTAVTSGLLQRNKVFIPTAQSFLNYLLLGLVYATILACRPRCGEGDTILTVLRQRGWKYFILAVIDVEANYLMVKAYHYTTVTSVQLLDCFTIPTVLLLSWLFLKVRYKIIHLAGVGVCIAGVVSLVLADVLVAKYDGDGKNKLLGDMLCLAGAVLYGISNVGQEYVVRSFNRVEYLGMLGLFGSIINGVQFALLERKEIASVDFSNVEVVLCLFFFAMCLFTLYSLMPVVIEKTSATSVNLNLLSADFYALLVGIFVFKDQFHPLYFVSILLIIVGIIVYSIRPTPVAATSGDYEQTLQADDIENVNINNTENQRLSPSKNSLMDEVRTYNSVSSEDEMIINGARGSAEEEVLNVSNDFKNNRDSNS